MSDKQMSLTIPCDRYWLLTWTMYGNRLAGDNRGFVSNVRDGDGPEVRHNIPGTEFDTDMPRLEAYIRSKMKGPPVRLNAAQAEDLLEQFFETADYRNWQLLAVAIMSEHCHVVIGVPGDPEPSDLLRDLKSYGSRRLNKNHNRPEGGTWWTDSGSKRKLADEEAILNAIQYTMDQEFPLVVWTPPIPELQLTGGRVI